MAFWLALMDLGQLASGVLTVAKNREEYLSYVEHNRMMSALY